MLTAFLDEKIVSFQNEKLMIDYTGMNIEKEFFDGMSEKFGKAFSDMQALERGAAVNTSEGRMVGHYWLRAPDIAPTDGLKNEIRNCMADIRDFAQRVRSGGICGENGRPFKKAVIAGIGGSSLGPRFVCNAIGRGKNGLELLFMDNTDPDGIDGVLRSIEPDLDSVIAIIVSKSGGTIETRNCAKELEQFYENRHLSFARHSVCISESGSSLDRKARQEGWLASFPMWDWVGGRTSVTSAVGLLPLALAGLDTDSFLRGAAECDELTRAPSIRNNPSALLAASWYKCSGGRGGHTMAVLPYKDSLSDFAKYLQQLVMESLGKMYDADGNVVNQGIAVIGNKGTSDQHSYVQQLVAGPENIFVIFIQVLVDRKGPSLIVGENSTSGDYLNAFRMGTDKALRGQGKHTLTVTIPEVNEYHVGQLIALFERAVGYYASLININAYDQPAVENGKKAAGSLISLGNTIKSFLEKERGRLFEASEVALRLSSSEEDVFKLLLHMAFNDSRVCMEERTPALSSLFGIK